MKVIIAGSRNGVDPIFFDKILYDLFLSESAPYAITEIVSGCASGVDTMAIMWADKHGFPVIRFPANWEELGSKAGPIRNADMAEYGDLLVAFFNAKSENRGTKNMVSQMIAKNKPVIRASEAIHVKREKQLSLFPEQ